MSTKYDPRKTARIGDGDSATAKTLPADGFKHNIGLVFSVGVPQAPRTWYQRPCFGSAVVTATAEGAFYRLQKVRSTLTALQNCTASVLCGGLS